MSDRQTSSSPFAVHVQVTVAASSGLSGSLPSGVDVEAFLSSNGTQLSDDELQRLILESPFLLRPGSSNFDPAIQVQDSCNIYLSPPPIFFFSPPVSDSLRKRT